MFLLPSCNICPTPSPFRAASAAPQLMLVSIGLGTSIVRELAVVTLVSLGLIARQSRYAPIPPILSRTLTTHHTAPASSINTSMRFRRGRSLSLVTPISFGNFAAKPTCNGPYALYQSIISFLRWVTKVFLAYKAWLSGVVPLIIS